jgi:CRP-like cAMP-binding protein
MPLRRDAQIDLLQRIPLFAQCAKKDLREIARVSREVDVEAGQVVIREGEPGHEFFVVVDGRLDVSRRRKGTFASVGPGDFVGEMALLSNKPRNATVTAATSSRLLKIEDRDFAALIERIPLLWLKIAGALAERMPDDAYLRS